MIMEKRASRTQLIKKRKHHFTVERKGWQNLDGKEEKKGVEAFGAYAFKLIFGHRRHRPCGGGRRVYNGVPVRMGGFPGIGAGKALAGRAAVFRHTVIDKGGIL